MSLIQEALKRKSEESGPTAPATKPLTKKPDTAQGPNTLLVTAIILLAVLVLALLTGGAVYLITLSNRPVLEDSPETTPTVPATDAAASAEPSGAANRRPAPPDDARLETADPIAQAAAPQKTESAVQPEPGKPQWPELQLSGIAFRGDRSIAIINGSMLSVGDQIDGVVIRRVEPGRVILEWNGERRTLRVK